MGSTSPPSLATSRLPIWAFFFPTPSPSPSHSPRLRGTHPREGDPSILPLSAPPPSSAASPSGRHRAVRTECVTRTRTHTHTCSWRAAPTRDMPRGGATRSPSALSPAPCHPSRLLCPLSSAPRRAQEQPGQGAHSRGGVCCLLRIRITGGRRHLNDERWLRRGPGCRGSARAGCQRRSCLCHGWSRRRALLARCGRSGGGPEGWGRHGAGPRVTAAAAVGNAHARIHEQQHLSRSGSCHRRENTMVSKNGTRARLEATATCNSPAGGCTLHVWMPCRYVACADVKVVGKVHLSVCPCGILHISTYRCNRSLGKALTPTHKHAWGDFPTSVQISISLNIPHICSSFLEDPSAHLPPWMEISPTDRKKHACVSGAGELATAQPPYTKGDTCFETTKGITCPIHRKHT